MNNEDAIFYLLNSNEYHHAKGDLPHSTKSIEAFNKAIEALKAETPKGMWYRTGQSFIDPNKFRNYGCSVCRYELDEHIREEPNFCPNCGADMRGEE